MDLRNIHFMDGDEEPQAAPAPAPSAAPEKPQDVRLRIRKTTVSPLEEFQLREGEVRPISDALAALICSRKGRAEISAKGIKVDRKDIGGVRIYHHPDSRLCNDLSQRERKIYYVLNSLAPDVVHLLDETGRYIESLPEKKQPGVLNTDEQAKEYADQKRQFNRVARHLQELHGDDTKQAIEDLRKNNSIAQRIVQVMPSGEPQSPSATPAPSRLGEQVIAGHRRINDMRQHTSNTLAIGRALASQRGPTQSPETTPTEDWSQSSRYIPESDATPTQIESW